MGVFVRVAERVEPADIVYESPARVSVTVYPWRPNGKMALAMGAIPLQRLILDHDEPDRAKG